MPPLITTVERNTAATMRSVFCRAWLPPDSNLSPRFCPHAPFFIPFYFATNSQGFLFLLKQRCDTSPYAAAQCPSLYTSGTASVAGNRTIRIPRPSREHQLWSREIKKPVKIPIFLFCSLSTDILPCEPKIIFLQILFKIFVFCTTPQSDYR